MRYGYEGNPPEWDYNYEKRAEAELEQEQQPTNHGGDMSKSLQWYKSLSLEQKFGLKESSAIICGIKWEDFTLLFSGSERIEILYNKLILEGIITEAT